MYKSLIKRILDLFIGLIGFPFFLIAYIVFAPIIKLTDKGPVFYSAKRIGKNGKLFKMYKFRSMYINSPDIRNEDGSTYNGADDPRVTGIGKFMRITSIDELPQIINIINGTMSVIGPRPDPPDDMLIYTEAQKKKLKVKPGLTGYNQAYFRNSVEQNKKFENDLFYANNVSFGFDVKIFFKTIITVLKRDSVYNIASSPSGEEVEKVEYIRIGKNKTIMIIGASILQLPAIEKATEMGLKVVAVDMNPNAIGFLVPGVIKEVISTIDIPAAVKAAKYYNIDGVMTLATDMPMRTVAAVAKECGLVGVSEDTAIKATDKSVMREALKVAGVPIPKFFRVTNEDEFKTAVKSIDGAFMVKPADSSGSRGILKVEDRANIVSAYEYTKQFSHSGIVVVEECMIGPEVSVETIAIDGKVHVIQITDKMTTGAPHFVEMGHTQPTKLDCAEEIKRVTIAANKAVGIENGPSHTEIIVTKDGPKIVEIGARLGGDCITTHLVPLSTGVNMVEACIRIALGEKPDITPTLHCGSAIRYFQQHAGVVTSIEGIEEVEKMPGIKQISIVHGVGEKITDITDSGSRMGFVIVQGTDADDAACIANTSLQLIKVTIVK